MKHLFTLTALLLVPLAALCITPAFAATYHVSRTGNDASDGTESAPFHTFQAAADRLQAGDTCVVHGGSYRETVRLRNSGIKGKPIRFEAAPGTCPTVDGTEPVSGPWSVFKGRIYRTRTDREFIQVFADGQMLVEARWPNRRFPEQLWDRDRWAHAGPGSRYGRVVDRHLAQTGIDWTGAVAVLNVAHQFFTWTRPVLHHTKGSNTFEYAKDLRGIAGEEPSVVWYHRNTRSIYALGLEIQHLEALKDRFADPLLDLTFGASLAGADFVRDGVQAIKSKAPAKRHTLSVTVLAARTGTPQAWLAELDRLVKSSAASSASRAAHEAWWGDFWQRSWIFVESAPSQALPANAHPWRVGAASDGRSRFGGMITGPRVIGRALSAAEIAGLARQQPAGETKLAQEALTRGCTVAAWIKPAAGEAGRILDKCTAGMPDGFTFDAYPGLSLRWIVGDHTMMHPKCLQPGQWQHVAATVDAGTGLRRIYANGKLVQEERGDPAGAILTRGYVLQRFMNACSGRGGSPIKFNGSIFTVEANPGASPETPAGDPDWRRWGGNYWFQNTRLAYWPMLAAGDFDLMEAWFRMYRDALPLSRARIQTYYSFTNAAQFPETMYWWGLPNNGDYGWHNRAPEPANGYIRRYWNGSLELVAVMLDRYDFTEDRQFAQDTLVPLADPLINFLNQYWSKRDTKGKIRFDPAQSLETWHSAVNPMPEIAGLRFLLPRLLALPAGVATADQRARWQKMRDELPPVPVAEVGGVKLLCPAETYSHKSNSENTELYGVFPYRLYGVGRADLDIARETYARRGHRHNRGWCQDSIQAACLGLGDEAARLVSARAGQINRDYRFPAMWGPNFDWIPDQDHGNNILSTLQLMLVQSDGDKIHVLPAWPRTWNASFKLHAPKNTTVEGVYRDGKLEQLTVIPETRRKDVTLCQ